MLSKYCCCVSVSIFFVVEIDFTAEPEKVDNICFLVGRPIASISDTNATTASATDSSPFLSIKERKTTMMRKRIFNMRHHGKSNNINMNALYVNEIIIIQSVSVCCHVVTDRNDDDNNNNI